MISTASVYVLCVLVTLVASLDVAVADNATDRLPDRPDSETNLHQEAVTILATATSPAPEDGASKNNLTMLPTPLSLTEANATEGAATATQATQVTQATSATDRDVIVTAVVTAQPAIVSSLPGEVVTSDAPVTQTTSATVVVTNATDQHSDTLDIVVAETSLPISLGPKPDSQPAQVNSVEPKGNKETRNPDAQTPIRQKRAYLHSNLDDLLRQRSRRALRFKRDTDYEKLMAIINLLNSNPELLKEQLEAEEEEQEPAVRESPDMAYVFNHGKNAIVLDEDDVARDDADLDALDENQLAFLNSLYTPSNERASDTYDDLADTQMYYPRAMQHFRPWTKRSSSLARMSTYYDRRPFGLLPGQRRKRWGYGGDWGRIVDRRSTDAEDGQVQRIYPVAAMLARQNYGRYKRAIRSRRTRQASMKAM